MCLTVLVLPKAQEEGVLQQLFSQLTRYAKLGNQKYKDFDGATRRHHLCAQMNFFLDEALKTKKLDQSNFSLSLLVFEKMICLICYI